jgi:hypothetical protein
MQTASLRLHVLYLGEHRGHVKDMVEFEYIQKSPKLGELMAFLINSKVIMQREYEHTDPISPSIFRNRRTIRSIP